MFANTKQFKSKIKQLKLPWWFNLAKWGIPGTIAALTAVGVICILGGWVAIPEGMKMLEWLVALFSTMQPVVKFLAIGLTGLGSFLSGLLMSSIFVRGILFYFTEKAAIDGEKISTDLFEQNKELQQDIMKAGELHQLTQEQLAFLKGFSTAKANKENDEDAFEKSSVDSSDLPEQSEPIMLFRNRSGETSHKTSQSASNEEQVKRQNSAKL